MTLRDEFGDKIILPDDPNFGIDTVTIAITEQELFLTHRIAERYKFVVETNGGPMIDAHMIWMDVALTHSNGCPLDLEKLLTASGQEFYDDVRGIETHIHRRTATLRGFTPKFALKRN